MRCAKILPRRISRTSSTCLVSAEDCSDVEVQGGAYSGIYSLSSQDFDSDGDVYSTETDDGNFAFLMFFNLDDRRRLEDARHDLEGMGLSYFELKVGMMGAQGRVRMRTMPTAGTVPSIMSRKYSQQRSSCGVSLSLRFRVLTSLRFALTG